MCTQLALLAGVALSPLDPLPNTSLAVDGTPHRTEGL